MTIFVPALKHVCIATALVVFSVAFARADSIQSVPSVGDVRAGISLPSTSPPADTAASGNADQTDALLAVPAGHWAYDAVTQLAKDGILQGYPGGTFKGGRPMTRYEVAVLAYRAVDQIEERLTAGQAVSRTDIDVANKLLTAFGAELQSVETHVDALQKQADATGAVAAATAATVRRQQIHLSVFQRFYSYDQSIQANNGPLPVTVPGVPSAGVIAPGHALPAYTGLPPTGNTVLGPAQPGAPGSGVSGGLSWGTQLGALPQNTNTIGNQNHGLGMSFLQLFFGGNPDDHSQYLIDLANLFRYSTPTFNATTNPAYCTNAGLVTGSACTGANAGPANADGVVNSLLRLQEAWYQYTSPGGLYVKVGKFQEDEGPKQTIATEWSMTDILDGARIGYRNRVINAQFLYGFDDSAATQNLLYTIPASQQLMAAEVDAQFDRGRTDIGLDYQTYLGFHQVLWDPYAVLCQGVVAAAPARASATGIITPAVAGNHGTAKVLPYRAGQTFMAGGCGSGLAPISFGANAQNFVGPNAGLPVTGAYISTGAGAMYPNFSIAGAFAVENYGKLRLVLEGTTKLGNDPFTRTHWTQNLTGFMQLDYGGPVVPIPGAKNQNTLEFQGFAVGFNGLAQSFNYFAGPVQEATFSMDPAGDYFALIGLKHYISDTASLGIYYAHFGLLPNEIIPAGSASCPGCAITGDSRNAVFAQFQLGF